MDFGKLAIFSWLNKDTNGISMHMTVATISLVMFSTSNSESTFFFFFLWNWTGQETNLCKYLFNKVLKHWPLEEKKKVLFLVAYFYESNHTPKVLFSLETSFCEELMLKPSLQSHLKKHNKARAGLQSIRNKHKIKCSYWLNTRTMFFFFFFFFSEGFL